MLFFSRFLRKHLTRPLRQHQARPAVEALESRLVPYSASTNVWPSPQLLTISFMPDGTSLGGGLTSSLFSAFNGIFGSAAAWQNQILKAAQQWGQQTNINFAVVGDNGTPFGGGMYQQGDPGMGDIRIGGYSFGNSTLAQTWMPPPVNNTSSAGDMEFNTGQAYNIGGGTGHYDLYTVAMHELGHALGLYHSATFTATMYAMYTSTKTGLGADDINGIRSLYSSGAPRSVDAFDAAAVNTNFANAANLSSLLDPLMLNGVKNGLDITTTSTSRYYTVTAPLLTSSTVTFAADSLGLSLFAPKLTVYASDMTTVLGTATVTGYSGGAATVTVTGVSAGQQFYLKVQGADATAFSTGAFALQMNFGMGLLPALTPPTTMLPNGLIPSAGGGQAIQLNPEFVVDAGASQTNTATPGSVAMDGNGNYVVVWASQLRDGDGLGVYARRFSAVGVPQGDAFQVNTTTAGDQTYASVAMNAAGEFVITWSSHGQDGDGWGVYAQRYSADGTASGSEFRVNTTTAGDQMYSSVAISNDGDFVITWSSNGQDGDGWGVYAQRYNADGTANGSEFRVNTTTAGDQMYSSVAMNAAGDFVITWSSNGQDGDGWGVYAQRYSADGTASGSEFRVNTTTAGDQTYASVAMNASGEFVIAWSSNGQDGDGWGIYAQRYNADGTASGSEFRVNTTTAGDQVSPSVALDTNGNFIITWSSNGQDGDGWGIYGQQFDATGASIGNEFRLNTSTAGDQQYATVAMDSTGNAVAVWSDSTTSLTAGVNGQRLLLNGASGLAAMIPTDGMAAPDDATDTIFANAAAIMNAATTTSSDSNNLTIQSQGHKPGCACPLCLRLAQALGITNPDSVGGYQTLPQA
jgi:hypothetical protein